MHDQDALVRHLRSHMLHGEAKKEHNFFCFCPPTEAWPPKTKPHPSPPPSPGTSFPNLLALGQHLTLGPLLSLSHSHFRLQPHQSSSFAMQAPSHRLRCFHLSDLHFNSLQPWRPPALRLRRSQASWPASLTPHSPLPGVPSRPPPRSRIPLIPAWSRLHHLYATDTQARGPTPRQGLFSPLSQIWNPLGFLDFSKAMLPASSEPPF